MEIMGLTWLGTRTEHFEATAAFFRDVCALPIIATETDMTVFSLPDDSTVEVFGPMSAYNEHLTQPVAGFRVRDLAAAHEELVTAGIEIVLPIQGGDDRRWLHVRAPDGFLYELVQSN